jgi:hypothetical protein
MARATYSEGFAKLRGDGENIRARAWLVGFAVLLPLLAMLTIGSVELGSLYSRNAEVGNAAREGARLAAAGELTGEDIIAITCANVDPDGFSSVEVGMWRQSAGVGDRADLMVRAKPNMPTGLLSPLLPTSLESSVETRLERIPAWSTTEFQAC